jgi:integrase
LRIGDAVQLDVNRIQRDKLLLHTEKTGVAVYCVLLDMVVKALDAAPHSSARYFFWTGKSTVRSAKGKWQRRLQRLFELAKVAAGHAHIAASELQTATAHLGRARDKSKSRPI